MRKVITGIALLMVTALRAITISWAIPNATYEWVADAEVHFVYSETQLSSADDYVAAKNATSIDAKNITGGIITDTVGGQTVYDGVAVTLEGYTSTNTGYYYAVFTSKTKSNNYAVLGGKKYLPGYESTTGVYDTDVLGPDGVPSGGEYVDIGPFLGGTWKAAKTPEPTVLALLSLGIAGVALRRKIAQS